jgi:hypothetical protein
MEKYQPIVLVQQAQLRNDHFDSGKFKQLVNDLNAEQFDGFCKEICSLNRFYESNLRSYPAPAAGPVSNFSESWTVGEIDFSHPVPGE